MACLGENTIAAFLEGRLASADEAAAEAHLAECAGCRAVIAEAAALGTAHHDAPAPAASEAASGPDPGLAQRLARAQAAKRVGRTLNGKWRLERLIGIGGMAQVFEATHRNGRKVAIKMMLPELAVEPSLVERFLREGYVANRVSHPGAVAVLDDDVNEAGEPFLVMELLEGETLRDRLTRAGPMPPAEAMRAMDRVLDVLAAAHERGIVHRDVKPDNVFVTTGGEVKVLDFGIARLRDRLKDGTHTQSGVTMGTIGYMPPEQARGQVDRIDARSDVWAAGATLYTLLTGAPVQDAPTKNEALFLAMTAPVPPVRSKMAGLAEDVAAVLDRALAFDKEARFPDVRAMQTAMRAVRPAAPEGVSATEVTKASPPGSTDVGFALAAQTIRTYDAEPTRAEPTTVDAPRGRPLGAAAAITFVAAVALGGAAVLAWGGRSAPAPATSPIPEASSASASARAEPDPEPPPSARTSAPSSTPEAASAPKPASAPPPAPPAPAVPPRPSAAVPPPALAPTPARPPPAAPPPDPLAPRL